ncbi:hypothetical protein KAI52_03920 [Candidatus Parcubacteria bacterium]|nr:hypothetical protein [Candidatus Parcubacteria bacterium]
MGLLRRSLFLRRSRAAGSFGSSQRQLVMHFVIQKNQKKKRVPSLRASVLLSLNCDKNL